MSQEEILDHIEAHPEGIIQAEVCKRMMHRAGGYVSYQIVQLRKWGRIRRENVGGKWRLYKT